MEQGDHTHIHREKEKIIIDRLTLGEPEHGDERERTRRNKFEQVTGRFLHWELRYNQLSRDLGTGTVLPASRVPLVTTPPPQACRGIHAPGQHGSGPQDLPHLPGAGPAAPAPTTTDKDAQ